MLILCVLVHVLYYAIFCCFFFKQKTAYEMRISDWSSDVCSSDLTRGDAAFLFGSDEEANDARCIEAFLKRQHGFSSVVVAEPTDGEAVLAHRGISSVLLRFKGQAGHASGAAAMESNALHQAMRWGTRALDLVEGESHRRFGGLTGLRFNVGRVEGGNRKSVV